LIKNGSSWLLKGVSFGNLDNKGKYENGKITILLLVLG
jgi:hypothetical protein